MLLKISLSDEMNCFADDSAAQRLSEISVFIRLDTKGVEEINNWNKITPVE